MRFNHLDLPVRDVSSAAAFFEQCFGLRRSSERPGFALMHDDSGFALVLSELGPDELQDYPRGFHVGFNLASAAEVESKYAGLSLAGVEMVRGIGMLGGALTFQCAGPGSIVVEVGHRAA